MKGKAKIVGISLLGVVVLATTIYVALGFFFDEDNIGVEITSRTEYIGGDIGQVLTEVRFAVSDLPAPATCWASALYPNKTAMFTDELMSSTGIGTYNYTFTVPSAEGVYEYQAICQVSPGRNITRSKAFHVSSSFRLLNEAIDEIPRVDISEEGVEQTRMNQWNFNGWRLEGQGDIEGASCAMYEGVRFASGDPDAGGNYFDSLTGAIEDPLVIDGETVGCSIWVRELSFNSRRFGLGTFPSNDAENIEGAFFNASECPYDGGGGCTWPADSNVVDFFVNDVTVYMITGERGIRKYASLGELSFAEYADIDCGQLNGPEPNWTIVTNPSRVTTNLGNTSAGQTWCFETWEGNAIFKLRSSGYPTGGPFTVWYAEGRVYSADGCNAGAFIDGNRETIGLTWYSNQSIFEYGKNYDVVCDVDYVVGDTIYIHSGLRDSVYITNEGKIRAFVTK